MREMAGLYDLCIRWLAKVQQEYICLLHRFYKKNLVFFDLFIEKRLHPFGKHCAGFRNLKLQF